MFTRLLGFVLVVSAVVLGNTYYIDYSAGANSNPGTSKSAPWKLCPGMNGFSATYTHASGDVFIFKGGVTWPSAALPFTIGYSGSAGNVDSYTTDHSWYAGSAWAQPTFDGQLFGQTLLYASEKSYVLINDLRLINAGTAAANGLIGYEFSDCSYFELSHNTFTPQSWGCLYVITERTGDFYNFFIHDNDISGCAFGMRFVPGAASSIMHNVQVYNNNIHDFSSQLSGAVHGDGIQYYNTPDAASSYDRYIDGFKIFNNHFYGNFGQAPGTGGAMTALIYLSGASEGVEIYDNLFAPQFSGSQSPNFFESFISLRDNPNRGGHHRIYNNTFVTPVPRGQSAAILEDDPSLPSPGLNIQNNIFTGFYYVFDLVSTNDTIDHNDDNFTGDSNDLYPNIGQWGGKFVGTFADWQALGLDAHGICANPGFVSATDFHLSQTSPCIGKGADLSSTVATDLDGDVRPGPKGFSLGAYEFGSAPPPPPVPSAPLLASPVNGATGVTTSPTLSWNAASGAASYSVQVSTASSFATTVAAQSGVSATSYSLSGLANGTTYYWRVSATDAGGASAWSSSGSFTTVAALLPSTVVLWWPGNGKTGVVINPSLTWAPDSGALSYSVQVSTVSSFATTVVNQSGITSTSYEPDWLSSNTTYYWRVNSTKAAGTTAWSAVGKFTTTAIAPTVALWWPSNGAKGVVLNPSLTWSPDSTAVSYSLQVASDSGFAALVVNQSGILTNSFEVNRLRNNTTYYWRVSETKANGTSGWTPSWHFTVSSHLAKEATSLLSPGIISIPRALDVYSCEHGVVQISLPSSGVYSLAIYSLNGQKAGTVRENFGAAGLNAVALGTGNISQGLYIMHLSMNGAAINKEVRVTN